MKFAALAVLDDLLYLYQLPRNRARFTHYLQLLQGPTGEEMRLPIAGFNPMGKQLALQQLETLIAFAAEEQLRQVVDRVNQRTLPDDERIIQVAINLVDDVEGAWSNLYTTDYQSKFGMQALLARNFCTPLFWTSESLTYASIGQRIEEQLHRAIFWLTQGAPRTLQHQLEQEIYVSTHCDEGGSTLTNEAVAELADYYTRHLDTTDYVVQLNFFYGDEASQTLNYATYGIPKNGGFAYAKHLACQRK